MGQLIPLKTWLYRDEFDTQFVQPNCDTEPFSEVKLPHANKEIPYNYFDEKMYQFVSCYRKTIFIPAEYKGKRIFLDFEGVMAYAEVFVNGELIGSHKGGYTPFSCELTESLEIGKENVIAVKVDSTEREDIPPFGHVIDYLTYGGIYREVHLRVEQPAFISNTFARPKDVLKQQKSLDTTVYLDNGYQQGLNCRLEMSLLSQGATIAHTSQDFELDQSGDSSIELRLSELTGIELWDVDHPHLYTLQVKLFTQAELADEYVTRIGFREAIMKPDGFYLNGRRLQIRGLNRHQAFPYVGYAMPERVQKRDADILKYELHLNTVRTSHYPQSRHFLDRCDEIGLLVMEEIPGWQHIGDEEWKRVACQDVQDMIKRDWNRPAIFLWGVRINESIDDHDFYTETNRIAHELDPTRQTGGVRYLRHSELLEDVYTANDFSHSGGELVLADPLEFTGLSENVPYLVTEYNGHMFPTKRFDQEERLMEHALRHVRVQNAAGLDPGISGAIGWCAFDYNTHYEFGSGDRICYHGVMDMFRIPKFAAYVYASQVAPHKAVVMEPVTIWARGERNIGGVLPLVILTNCDYVDVYLSDKKVARAYPDRTNYPGLEHPPIVIKDVGQFGEWGCAWFGGKVVGYLDDKEVTRKEFVKNPLPTELQIVADDTSLNADGVDATRVVCRMLDQAGNVLPFIPEYVRFELSGPGEIIGPQEAVLIGGCIATWVRAGDEPGQIRFRVRGSRLESEQIAISVEDGNRG